MLCCTIDIASQVSSRSVPRVGNYLVAVSDEERTPTEYPSTGGLQILLQQTFLRESFRGFIKQKWMPNVNSDTNQGFKNSARMYALNCIDFLTDVRDFYSIQNNSLFQSYRACHIFEKYIMHSAVQQVR